MVTLTADKAQAAVQPRFLHEGLVHEVAAYTATVTFAAADIIQMFKAPAGAVIHDAMIISDNNISVGTGDATMSLGDGGVPERYLSSGAGSSTTLLRMTTAPGYQYSAQDTVDITIVGIGTGSATGDQTSAAILKVSVVYSCDKTKDGGLAGGTTAGG